MYYPGQINSLPLSLSLVILQGWSLSDVMFVTKNNMANAVATVSKQLEHVSETLAVSCKLSKLICNGLYEQCKFLVSAAIYNFLLNFCSQQRGI